LVLIYESVLKACVKVDKKFIFALQTGSMDQQQIVSNKRNDLIQPELSFKIMGCAFDVYNELGYGYAEKDYQKALAISFRNKGIAFKEQVYFPIKFEEELIRKGFCDFIVEDKIIIELKKNPRFSRIHIERVNQYLKSSKLQLALLINYAPTGVISKRLLNLY
jgi:GxxExxY protein